MRRVAAVVLPELACELVRQRVACGGPLAIILEPAAQPSGEGGPEIAATARLDAVSEEARRYGVRPGQSVTEATAIVADLAIHRVTHDELDAALGRVAELALALGTTAALTLEVGSRDPSTRSGLASAPSTRAAGGAAPFDTVWLDITGAAHLVGGESALLGELAERVAALGHRARLAIADGPRLAEALARWSGERAIAAPGEGARALAGLPIRALPIDAELASFFVRLGVLEVRDLARLPRAAAAARLGPRASVVLALVEGRDATPLVPYAPPRVLVEDVRFEEGTAGVEPLLFVLRGMTSRLAARLGARGEAATRLELVVSYDASIARLRAAGAGLAEAPLELAFTIELPAPLAREADLLRPLRTKLEATTLFAPAVGVRLSIPQIVRASEVQLDLSRDVAVSPDALPALLAELSAEIGAERVGVLSTIDAHRPEARSALAPALARDRGARAAAPSVACPEAPPDELESSMGPQAAPYPSGLCPLEATRLLPVPLRIGRVRVGAVVAIEQRLYAIERVEFLMRLDGIEWWTESPASRDYARAWLVAGERGRSAGGAAPVTTMEAIVFVDRATGECFLQGFCE